MTDSLFKLDPKHFPALAAACNTNETRLREAHHLHDVGFAAGMLAASEWLRENGEQFGAITVAIADALREQALKVTEDVRVTYLDESEVN